jgi:hypothetical protein
MKKTDDDKGKEKEKAAARNQDELGVVWLFGPPPRASLFRRPPCLCAFVASIHNRSLFTLISSRS